jgi:hypothetical protein
MTRISWAIVTAAFLAAGVYLVLAGHPCFAASLLLTAAMTALGR